MAATFRNPPTSPENRLTAAERQLAEISGCRNLHPTVPVVLFLGSGGLAVRSFFWGIDLATWLGFDRLDPVLPASVSFVLMFVAWILVYLFGMTLLDLMNFRDVRLVARDRLAKLGLTADELHALRRRVGREGGRHAAILDRVIAGLEPATP